MSVKRRAWGCEKAWQMPAARGGPGRRTLVPWLPHHGPNGAPDASDALPLLDYSDRLGSSGKEQLVLTDEPRPLPPEPPGPKPHAQTSPREKPPRPRREGCALCKGQPSDRFLNSEAHRCHPTGHDDTARSFFSIPKTMGQGSAVEGKANPMFLTSH